MAKNAGSDEVSTGHSDEEPDPADDLGLITEEELHIGQSQIHADQLVGVGNYELPNQSENHAAAAQAAATLAMAARGVAALDVAAQSASEGTKGNVSPNDAWEVEAQVLLADMDDDETAGSESDCESTYSVHKAEVGVLQPWSLDPNNKHRAHYICSKMLLHLL